MVRSLARLVLCIVSVCSALRSTVAIRSFLSPRCGTRIATREPRCSDSHSISASSPSGRVGTRISRGIASARLTGIHLLDEPLDQVGGRRVTVGLVGDPAALTADPPAAHIEDLHRDLERVLRQRDHVRVGAVAEHYRVLRQRLVQRAEVVADLRGPLVLQLGRRGLHLLLQPAHVRRGLAGQEGGEVVDDLAVLVLTDLAGAGRGALADVAEQAGPADLAVPVEDALAARAHREHPQQQVDGLADRPGVTVRTEVPDALLLRAAADHHPRVLLVQGDREPRVRLVVAVLHVEARVVLLDPGVLQLQRLDLVGDHRPVDLRRGRHHRLGPRVQVDQILEVRRQPGPQVLRLADIDHPPGGVAEAIHTRRVGNRPGSGTVGGGISHRPSLVRAADKSGIPPKVSTATSMTDLKA